ncbi:hypothetical protein [Streptomyces hainanensis]|uniref:DUF8094 domain-containing protein n=1 Tax=Streptomyces hainanensis TaxID=402648 RepID=A0A4R4TD04_9ACTN|nr:hypothetical protein [Streptomyces hainanensis]TDC72713.1 hypothetical protein E1283_21045 [Streptomyces hainanensis]
MRLRARLSTTAAGLTAVLALTTGLSGCMTVHGEEAIVPALTTEEAQAALDHYVEVYNEAKPANDAELNATIETGGLGAVNGATLDAKAGAIADAEEQGDEQIIQQITEAYGPESFRPLELSDVQYHIPEQAGWPKFFVADASSNLAESRWLLVFTRDALDEDWRVSYLAQVPGAQLPELADEENGALVDIPATGGEGDDLVVPPGELSAAYAEYLSSNGPGEAGEFAEGRYTSDALASRAESNSSAAFRTEFIDEAAEGEEFAPVAMRTADGGALVFFTTQHGSKQTVAEGESPAEVLQLDPAALALMDGDAQRAVTWERIATQVAYVPAGEGQVQILSQIRGATAIAGE